MGRARSHAATIAVLSLCALCAEMHKKDVLGALFAVAVVGAVLHLYFSQQLGPQVPQQYYHSSAIDSITTALQSTIEIETPNTCFFLLPDSVWSLTPSHHHADARVDDLFRRHTHRKSAF